MPHRFDLDDILLEPPLKRAAYSDRMAWHMAVMSSLAYVKFEQPTSLDELAQILANEHNEKTIVKQLSTFLKTEKHKKLKAELEDDLGCLGFELVNTYNISEPPFNDTQAFLAKLTKQGRPPMLVLAFRGTEVRKPADIRADVAAEPTNIGPQEKEQKVHSGFYKAFKVVKKNIEADLSKPELIDLPLYITGHSLGGALAIIATYALNLPNDKISACYTFGCPRVGNLAFGQSLRSPVYRVVNAADLVPRLPPSYMIEGITLLLRWLPVIPYNEQIADFFDKFRHYRHYGDMRYLTAATRSNPELEGEPATYTGLQVLSNPPQLSRWIWQYQRLIATWGSAGITDHSINTYVEKLAYWAISRHKSVQQEQPLRTVYADAAGEGGKVS